LVFGFQNQTWSPAALEAAGLKGLKWKTKSREKTRARPPAPQPPKAGWPFLASWNPKMRGGVRGAELGAWGGPARRSKRRARRLGRPHLPKWNSFKEAASTSGALSASGFLEGLFFSPFQFSSGGSWSRLIHFLYMLFY